MSKVVFRYSRIYDTLLQEWIGKANGKPNYKILKPEELQKYIRRIEKVWRKQEKMLLTEISKISGLKWRTKEVICYVVGRSRPFSDPLTIRPFAKDEEFVDTLTHEMIHQITIQNWPYTRKAFRWIESNYRGEPRVTKNHIFLHAMHYEIVLKKFGKKRADSLIEKDKRNAKLFGHIEYPRSWGIVQKRGHENIIREFRKRIV